MRKIFNFAIVFAAAAAMVSCVKENVADTELPALSGKTKTITITSDIASTRTAVDGDHKISWAKGDTFGILYADASNTVIGGATSPEYDPAVDSYTLEVPEEVEALYCYYPTDMIDLGWGTPVYPSDLSAVEIPLSDGGGSFAESNYMTASAELDGDSVSLSFAPIATVIEVNVYDSTGTEEGNRFQGVTISADKAFTGDKVTYDFLTGTIGNYTETSNQTWFSYDCNYTIGTDSDNCATIYAVVGKGTYEWLEFTIQTMDEDYESNYYTYKFNNQTIEKNGYIVTFDLADAAAPAGPVFESPSVSELEYNEWFDNGYDKAYSSVPQYALTMRDIQSVTFETAPENVTVKAYYFEDGFSGGSTDSEAEFTLEDGTLTISNFEEYGPHYFRLYFYENGNESTPIAIIALTYFVSLPEVENTDTIEGVSIAGQGTAVLSELTSGDGYLEEYECNQYKLAVSSDVSSVYFGAIPNIDYVVFENKSTKAEASFFTKGSEAGEYVIGKPESKAYWVAFGGTEEPSCILYVVITDEITNGGDDGDDEDEDITLEKVQSGAGGDVTFSEGSAVIGQYTNYDIEAGENGYISLTFSKDISNCQFQYYTMDGEQSFAQPSDLEFSASGTELSIYLPAAEGDLTEGEHTFVLMAMDSNYMPFCTLSVKFTAKVWN